jgi:hypothetical protein
MKVKRSILVPEFRKPSTKDRGSSRKRYLSPSIVAIRNQCPQMLMSLPQIRSAELISNTILCVEIQAGEKWVENPEGKKWRRGKGFEPPDGFTHHNQQAGCCLSQRRPLRDSRCRSILQPRLGPKNHYRRTPWFFIPTFFEHIELHIHNAKHRCWPLLVLAIGAVAARGE